jgi:hypothetical protein
VIRRSVISLLALAGSAGLLPAQLALTCPFDANAAGDIGGVIYFDLEVKLKTTLFALDCNFGASVGTPVRLEVWITEETRVGKLQDRSFWELAAQDDGSALSAGSNQATRISFEAPLPLKPGRIGVALVAFHTSHIYTDVSRTIADGFLSVDAGEASNIPFGGTMFTPRSWNGRLIYGPKTVKGPYLYAYDNDNRSIRGFLLDKKTGVPGQLLGSPFAASGGSSGCGGNCQTLAADPQGRFVFAATRNGLSVLRKGAGGVLTEVAGSPFAGASRLLGLGAWSSGSRLLVYAVANNAGVLNCFDIDVATGTATLRPQAPAIGSAGGAVGIAVGRNFLYVVNEDDANLHGFSIDPTSGTLAPTPNSPYSIPGIEDPFNVVLDSKQTLLAVNDCDEGDYGFASIDKATGALLFPRVVSGASNCSEAFGFSSKGTFYGGGESVIDVIASGPTLVGSPTMPALGIDVGLIAPKGTAVYFTGRTSLFHAPIDKRLQVPIANQTTELSVVFSDPPTGMVLVSK